jgi:hypothetical protein
MKNTNAADLPTTFSSNWATEVVAKFWSSDVAIAIKSDRTGQRGSWSVHFRGLGKLATGYKLFMDGLDVQDDAWEAANELLVQLERRDREDIA